MTSRSPEAAEADTLHCARHPDVETELRCGRCETLICPRCLVYTPAGVRCPDCGRTPRLPMYQLTWTSYARLITAASVLAFALGVISVILLPPLRGFLFLFVGLIAGSAGGGALATLLSRASGGKRGAAVQAAAVGSLAGAYAVRVVLLDRPDVPAGDLGVLMLVVVAAVVAFNQLR